MRVREKIPPMLPPGDSSDILHTSKIFYWTFFSKPMLYRFKGKLNAGGHLNILRH